MEFKSDQTQGGAGDTANGFCAARIQIDALIIMSLRNYIYIKHEKLSRKLISSTELGFVILTPD